MSGVDEYWRECIEISFGDHGVAATPEQIEAVAGDVQACHENYGLVCPTPPSPLAGDLERAKRELADERKKIVCPQCNGTGLLVTYGPVHSSETQCWKCRGEGRVAP